MSNDVASYLGHPDQEPIINIFYEQIIRPVWDYFSFSGFLLTGNGIRRPPHKYQRIKITSSASSLFVTMNYLLNTVIAMNNKGVHMMSGGDYTSASIAFGTAL